MCLFSKNPSPIQTVNMVLDLHLKSFPHGWTWVSFVADNKSVAWFLGSQLKVALLVVKIALTHNNSNNNNNNNTNNYYYLWNYLQSVERAWVWQKTEEKIKGKN